MGFEQHEVELLIKDLIFGWTNLKFHRSTIFDTHGAVLLTHNNVGLFLTLNYHVISHIWNIVHKLYGPRFEYVWVWKYNFIVCAL